jgi:hypothetical protein
MHLDCINDPFLGFYQGIPVSIGFAHVLEDTLAVSYMDADCDEPGMAVDADTVGLEDLNLNTLVSFRSNDDFGSGIGDVYWHDKNTGIETGAPFDLGLENDAAIAECGVNWTKRP